VETTAFLGNINPNRMHAPPDNSMVAALDSQTFFRYAKPRIVWLHQFARRPRYEILIIYTACPSQRLGIHR